MASGEVVKTAQCGCCGMWEECTVGYIVWVQERFGGVWVCGLCEEAVKDEQQRLGVGIDLALRVHAMFREAVHADPDAQIVPSIVQLIKKIISAAAAASSSTTTTSISKVS